MSKFSLLFSFCCVGIIASLFGVTYGLNESLTKLEQNDIILIEDFLTDIPYQKTTGGPKNPQTYVVISLNKYQGRNFKIPIEYFKTKNAQLIFSKLKPKSKVTVGFLKTDYEFLKPVHKRWGLVEGFSRSKKFHNTPLYSLSWKNKQLLTLDYINAQNRKDGIIHICGGSFFLLVSILGIKEVWKSRNRNEAVHNKR